MSKEPKKEDITYENGFPANIDWRDTVVLQVNNKNPLGRKVETGLILYTCKRTGYADRCYLGMERLREYDAGIYIFTQNYERLMLPLEGITPDDTKWKFPGEAES